MDEHKRVRPLVFIFHFSVFIESKWKMQNEKMALAGLPFIALGARWRFFGRSLTQRTTVGDAPTAQIIRRQFHRHDVARQNTNKVFSNFAGDMRQYFVAILKPNAKLSVRERLRHPALSQDAFFLCHTHHLK
jgi:hypothetical protein